MKPAVKPVKSKSTAMRKAAKVKKRIPAQQGNPSPITRVTNAVTRQLRACQILVRPIPALSRPLAAQESNSLQLLRNKSPAKTAPNVVAPHRPLYRKATNCNPQTFPTKPTAGHQLLTQEIRGLIVEFLSANPQTRKCQKPEKKTWLHRCHFISNPPS